VYFRQFLSGWCPAFHCRFVVISLRCVALRCAWVGRYARAQAVAAYATFNDCVCVPPLPRGCCSAAPLPHRRCVPP
jgi:hypothetical protein